MSEVVWTREWDGLEAKFRTAPTASSFYDPSRRNSVDTLKEHEGECLTLEEIRRLSFENNIFSLYAFQAMYDYNRQQVGSNYRNHKETNKQPSDKCAVKKNYSTRVSQPLQQKTHSIQIYKPQSRDIIQGNIEQSSFLMQSYENFSQKNSKENLGDGLKLYNPKRQMNSSVQLMNLTDMVLYKPLNRVSVTRSAKNSTLLSKETDVGCFKGKFAEFINNNSKNKEKCFSKSVIRLIQKLKKEKKEMQVPKLKQSSFSFFDFFLHECRALKNTSDNFHLFSQELFLNIQQLRHFQCNKKLSFKPISASEQNKNSKATIIVDLDETLVFVEPLQSNKKYDHVICSNHKQLGVQIRPYASTFLAQLSIHFDIFIYTASVSVYADKMRLLLDPQRTIIKNVFSRSHCVETNKYFLKSLNIFGNRKKENTLIVENSLCAFPYDLENVILVKSYHGENHDGELLKALLFIQRYLQKEMDFSSVLQRTFQLSNIAHYSDQKEIIEFLENMLKRSQ